MLGRSMSLSNKPKHRVLSDVQAKLGQRIEHACAEFMLHLRQSKKELLPKGRVLGCFLRWYPGWHNSIFGFLLGRKHWATYILFRRDNEIAHHCTCQARERRYNDPYKDTGRT